MAVQDSVSASRLCASLSVRWVGSVVSQARSALVAPSGSACNARSMSWRRFLMPTVLVIDDDPLVAASVRSAVPGWTVLETYDGASGIALVREQGSSLDLVVLDVRMPHHDGVLV